ncbi:unnamed protein product [Tenebrio molitor]|nr:unnamed protein product [Tenebrio molitor]
MISLISLLGNEGAPVVFRATDREKAWCKVMASLEMLESPIKRPRCNHRILRNRWHPIEKVPTLGLSFSSSQMTV